MINCHGEGAKNHPTQRWEFMKESKKTRKQAFDQENGQEKKKVFFFFLGCSRSCFLSFFLDRYRFFLFFLIAINHYELVDQE